jgi:hypothetical protein
VINNIEVTEVMVQQGTNLPPQRRRRQISLEVQENNLSVQLNIRENPSLAAAANTINNESIVSMRSMEIYYFKETDVFSLYTDIILNYMCLSLTTILIKARILWEMPIFIIFIQLWAFDFIDYLRLGLKLRQLDQ